MRKYFSLLFNRISLAAATLVLSSRPIIAQAQENNESFTDAAKAPFNPDLGYEQIKGSLPFSRFDSIQSIIDFLFSYVTLGVAILAFIGILISGIMIIMAGGDADKAKKGKQSILYIATGIVIYLLIFVFITYIRGFLEGIFNPI